MARLLLVSLLCLLVLIGGATHLLAQTPEAQAAPILADAEILLSQGDAASAQASLETLIATYPLASCVWEARVRLSECYAKQERFDDAITTAQTVINNYPLEAPQVWAAWAQYHIGVGYYGKQDAGSALSELARVSDVLGSHSDRSPLMAAKCKTALIQHVLNNRDAAIAITQEVLADPNAGPADKASASVRLGASLIGNRKVAEGLAILNGVRTQYPTVQVQLKDAERHIFDKQYIGSHDYDGAISFGNSIMSDSAAIPERARQAGYFVCLAHLYKKDYSNTITAAESLLTRFQEPASDRRQWLMMKARAQARTNDYQGAIATLESVLATNPTDVEFNATVEWDLATCHRALGHKYLARKKYMRLTEFFQLSHLADRARTELKIYK